MIIGQVQVKVSIYKNSLPDISLHVCCTRHLLVCRGNFFFQSLPLVLAVPVEENKIARKLCLKLGYALERLGLLESVFFIWPEQQNNYDRFLYVSNT